jgi:hypothetical protein
LADLHAHIAAERVVSKSLANLNISKPQTVSSTNPIAPSPTSSPISSSDEIIFLGKDPIARQHVTPETAGWDFAGATTGLTPTATKALIQDPKDDDEADEDEADEDEAIIRDYMENVGGFDSLRDALDGGSGQFGFLSRPLDIGEESGLEELHRSTRDIAYGIQKEELFAAFPTTFEKSDIDDDGSSLGDEDYSSSLISAYQRKTNRGGSAITGAVHPSPSLVDLVDGPGSDFDVTDRSRLSLQLQRRKGAMALPRLQPDAEFQESMEEALSIDRQKKMARRKERETLRKQGLLGNSKPELKAKYEEGMNLDQIKQEFMRFCSSTHQKYVSLDNVFF